MVCGSATSNSYPCVPNADVAKDLSQSRLINQAPSKSLNVQLLAALNLVQLGTPSHPLVIMTLQNLSDATRISGRTAYVSSSPGASSAASMEVQALSLLLLTLVPGPLQSSVLPKLALFVSQGGPQGRPRSSPADYSIMPLPHAFDPRSTSISIFALATYDLSSSSNAPNLGVNATSGSLLLLNASFTSSSRGKDGSSFFSSTTPWEALPSPPSPVQFTAIGKGQASIFALLEFVPANLLPFPSYRGIWVESTIQAQSPTGLAIGPNLNQAPLKSQLTITIQIMSPDDLGPVTVSIPLPAGLEPIDPNLFSSSGSSCAFGAIGFRPWYWWWPVCPSQETNRDQVNFHYMRLTSGSWTMTVNVVAASEGTFVLPPISASADLQPEVMGMTKGGSFVVCSEDCQAVATPPAAPPKTCPSNCNGSGTCNLSTGACLCNPGFSGSDCSAVLS